MKIVDLLEAINFEKTLSSYKDRLEARQPKETSAEDIIQHLIKTLSTQQQKYPYVKWILDHYLSGDIKKAEDFSRAAVALEVISQKKHLLPTNKRDINQIRSFDELESLKEKLEAQSTGKQIKSSEKEKIYQEIEVVYDGPEGRILIPKTEAASCFLGKGTRWCIAATKGDNYFNYYNNRGPLYVILPSDGNKFQFHLVLTSLMNEKDEPVEFDEFKSTYPWVFSKIKFSEQQQKLAVQQTGYALQYIKDPSEAVQRLAVKQNGYAIEYIKDPSEAVQKLAVQKNGYVLQYIKDPSEKVQKLAVQENGYALQYIKDPSEKVQKLAVQKNGYVLQYIKDPSEAVQRLAVQENGYALQYIKDPSEAVQRLAVQENGTAIEFIRNPSEAVQRLAVQKDSYALQNIKDPSEEVQRLAVKENGHAIQYIKDPSEEIKRLANENR
jgi:DNA-dependent RNA polymerase auxiliary subunit epsilon